MLRDAEREAAATIFGSSLEKQKERSGIPLRSEKERLHLNEVDDRGRDHPTARYAMPSHLHPTSDGHDPSTTRERNSGVRAPLRLGDCPSRASRQLRVNRDRHEQCGPDNLPPAIVACRRVSAHRQELFRPTALCRTTEISSEIAYCFSSLELAASIPNTSCAPHRVKTLAKEGGNSSGRKRIRRSVSLQKGIDFHVVFLEAGANVVEGFVHAVRKLQHLVFVFVDGAPVHHGFPV
jgi:hypothetical protein